MITLNKKMGVIFVTAMFGIIVLVMGYLAHELWKQDEKFLSIVMMLSILIVVAAVVCIWLSSGVITW